MQFFNFFFFLMKKKTHKICNKTNKIQNDSSQRRNTEFWKNVLIHLSSVCQVCCPAYAWGWKNELKQEVVIEGFVLEKALMWLMGKYSIRTAAVNMLWNTRGINCFALQRFEAYAVISETFSVMLYLSRSTIVSHVSVRSLKEQSLTKRDVLIMSHVLFFLPP